MAGKKVVPGSPPSDVAEGTLFASRNELCDSGVHGVRMQGIWTSEGRVIGIVLNGGYEDDIDLGDVIVYTGDGGRDPNTGKQIEDQGFTSGNRGLVIAKALKTPIRVTRGWKCKSDQAPAKGFRYDGLYNVGTYEYVRGSEGYFVWQFTLLKHSSSSNENTGETGQPEDFGADDFSVFLEDDVSANQGGRRTELQNQSPELFVDSGTVQADVDQIVTILLGDKEGINPEKPDLDEGLHAFKPIHLKGTGIGVFRLQIPQGLDHSQEGAALLLHWKQIVYADDAITPRFEVRFFQADGTQCAAELSENYGYQGTQVLVFDQIPVVCEVVTSGKWQIDFERILTCPNISNVESGDYNSVFRFEDYLDSGKIIRVTSEKKLVSDGENYSGGTFQLRAYGKFVRTQYSWLNTPVNVSLLELLESYDSEFAGERVLPSGTILVEVRSPGRNWSLNLEDL